MGTKKTTVVNRTDYDADTYIGRKKQGDAIKHLSNSTPDEPGWLGNPAVMEANVKPIHREQGDIVIVPDREAAVAFFERVFKQHIAVDIEFREAVHALEGDRLGCWCKPKACHGDVIARYLNGDRTEWHEADTDINTASDVR